MNSLENRRLRYLYLMNAITDLPLAHLDRPFRVAIELGLIQNNVPESELLFDTDMMFGVLSNAIAMAWGRWFGIREQSSSGIPRYSPRLDFKYQRLLLAHEISREASHLSLRERLAWIERRLGISPFVHGIRAKALRRIIHNNKSH